MTLPARNRNSTGPRQTSHPGKGLRLVGSDSSVGDTQDIAPAFTSLPSGDNLGKVQELYRELAGTVFSDLRSRMESGGRAAQDWLGRFVELGTLLGVPTKASVEPNLEGTAATLLRESLAQRRVPGATYRLQLHPGFTFSDASDLVSYLHTLGISVCYTSPILQARAGSTHGYDVCDHSRLNPDLGGAKGFEALAATLRRYEMGLILDAVPNHMGIADPGNFWWMDVLENGPGSLYASFFDIDWHPVNPNLRNKVLLPLLEDQYGHVLEAGKIRLSYDEGAFFLQYYQTRLPVAPCTYPAILELALADLARSLGEAHTLLGELRSIQTALHYLPPRTDLAADKIIERHREKEVIKRRLAALCHAAPEIRTALAASVRTFNGTTADSRSFDLLDALIEKQAYRLAFWRVAAEEINYRRFFDVNELAAIRMELPEVFRSTHEVLLRLLAEGKATGLRIDHPDGLRDPAGYFRQLQQQYLLARIDLKSGCPPETMAREVAAVLAREAGNEPRPVAWPLYVVAEKILAESEQLPSDWAVDGTTGYDFLNAVNGLFVDSESREAFDRTYGSFTGASTRYDQRVSSAKRMIMLVSMASEINALAHQLDRIAERNRRCRDFTLNSLTFALREVIACLPVYRTYITGPGAVSARDRRVIDVAVEEAKRRNPRTAEAIFDFVRAAVLLSGLEDFPEPDRPRLIGWALKFQQLTGPIMAKSVEDTVFYSYNRLVSLNEVGGSPDQFGISVPAFHRQNAERLERWPHSLLSTSTHDTKRSEDVRARLNVLSEMPGEWQSALSRWGRLNSSKKTVVEDQPAPDRNDEYLLYQTLLGAWPVQPFTAEGLTEFRRRIAAYMQKATKEAKIHTSWVNPNEEYDEAVRGFVHRLLPDAVDDPFLVDLMALQGMVAFFGYFNSLAQVLLKMACPGVPDLYQGTELWDFSLVDPDNRRPVDYPLRLRALEELRNHAEPDRQQLISKLLAHPSDGRIKLFLIYQMLNFRRACATLFESGDYLPLEAAGSKRDHVCAFARAAGDQVVIVAVPRFVFRLAGGIKQAPLGPALWEKTRLLLPSHLVGRTYRNIFTREVHSLAVEGTPDSYLGTILGQFPVAVLYSGPETVEPFGVAQKAKASKRKRLLVRRDRNG